jgi:fermentation-respiration switch protein FrsA (DUF1100 family)
MWSILKLILVAGVLVYAGLCLYLWAVQGRYMYYPGDAPSLTPASLHLPFDDLNLTTTDGETLHAWYVPVATNAANLWTLILCHGNGGNIENRLDSLKALHDLGINAFIFDYRGYGRSTGVPSEAGTYEDAMTAWRYLTGVRGCSTKRIVIFGESMGGAVAIDLAQRVQPGALVVESTFTSSPDMAAGMFPFLPARHLCRFQYNSLSKIDRVQCPVLIAHGPDDETIPFRQGRRLFDAATEPKQFFQLSGGHNAGGLLAGNPAYRNVLESFLRTASR